MTLALTWLMSLFAASGKCSDVAERQIVQRMHSFQLPHGSGTRLNDRI